MTIDINKILAKIKPVAWLGEDSFASIFDKSGEPLITISQARALAERVMAAQQAVIDRLMLEHCPYEMTPKQISTWERSQQPTITDIYPQNPCPNYGQCSCTHNCKTGFKE